MEPTKKDLEKAKIIIEELIHYDAWRDNLHPNDFPYTRNKIAQLLSGQRTELADIANGYIDPECGCDRCNTAKNIKGTILNHGVDSDKTG